MKTVLAAFLLLTAATLCLAQGAPTDPPDLIVLKFDWTKERISWAGDPFGVPNESYNEMRERVRTERRPRSALEEKGVRDSRREKEKPGKPPRYVFRYVLIVKNTASKAIKEIDWDYEFSDAVSGEFLGKHEFTSVEGVGPGNKKKLSILVSAAPTQTVSVHSLRSDERGGMDSRVAIVRILYEDGSIWSRPE